ncbi:MAG: hypothetical protein ACJASR_001432 [Psychroserpens sp.]|jgi:hypothetical protein
MRITANFDKRILNISSITGNIKSNFSRALDQSGELIEQNIKSELRSANKTGTIKRTGSRRSAPGESLARDTGKSEKLIGSNKVGSNKLYVGFAPNTLGYDYIKEQEESNNRPTMELAIKKSLNKIQSIFDSNMKPK